MTGELITMRRRKVAVLIASIDREYQQNFALGLASAGAEYGIDVCIFNSQGHSNVEVSTSDTGESMIYDLLNPDDFDGFISLPATTGNDTALSKMYDVLARIKGKPHVSIDIPQDGAVMITFNDQDSMETLTEHLISDHGARKIAFVSGPRDAQVANNRIEACRNAMKRHGLDLDPDMIFDGQWTRIGGRVSAEKMLHRANELPDAVMCGNDDMALSVIECLKGHGIRVPEDMIVTGFDAIQEAVMRGLTTIDRPINKSAQKAIEILSSWIDGEEPEEKTVVLPTEPVYGSSCGCKQDSEMIAEKLRALVSEKWGAEASLIRISMLSGVMAGVSDESEAREMIRSFTEALNIREFYLCADPAICRAEEASNMNNSYPDRMLLLFGFRDNQTYHSEIIPTRSLIPGMNDARDDSACLVFCPLYYRDQIMGYAAMDLGTGTGPALYPVLMLLNGALMSLYMQTSSKRAASTIECMARQDIMTGMLNRRGYMEHAPGLLEKARDEGKAFVLLSADINRMKFINDRYGHLAGDEAICRMGRALQCLTGYGLTPVHISGDEFLAYGIVDNPTETERFAQFVKDELARMNQEDPWICDITAGVGVYAAVPGREDSIDAFMTHADHAMYEDKNKRKYGRRKDDIIPEHGTENRCP